MDSSEQLTGTPLPPPRSAVRLPSPRDRTLPDNYGTRSGSPHSVTSSITKRQPLLVAIGAVLGWVKAWRLWSHTSPLGIAWLLVCELAVVTYIVVSAIRDGPPTLVGWTTFGLLFGATAMYMTLTWPTETANRAARVDGEHIDYTGVFTVAAALVLPISLLVVLVVAIRTARYFIASKPPVRVIFGTAAILASCVATHEVSSATDVDGLLAGTTAFPDTVIETAAMVAAILAAVAVYYAAQTILVGVARGFGGTWCWRTTIGTKRENAELICTISLGLLAAVHTSSVESIFLLAAVIVAAQWTRSSQGEADGSRDSTTGLSIRKPFEVAASAAVSNALRTGSPAAFVLFDVDFFKRINDEHSHAAGDAVLAAVAKTLLDHTRRGRDIVGRWGGEEFAVLLPGAAIDEACIISDRIRIAVANLTVEYLTKKGGKKLTVDGFTISGGIALSPGNGCTLEILCVHADDALYQSKRNGRNRITVAPQLADTMATLPAERSDDSSAAIGA